MFTHNLIASSLICRRVDYGMCNAVRYKHTYTYVPTLVHIQLVLTFTLVRFLYSLQLNNSFGFPHMYGTVPTISVNFPVIAITLNSHRLGSCTP